MSNKPSTSASALARFRHIRIPLLGKMLFLLLSVTLAPLSIFGSMSIRRALYALELDSMHDLQAIASMAGQRLELVGFTLMRTHV